MTTLENLHQAVRATLASQRLGTPVFVRYLRQTSHEVKLSQLARMVAETRRWLGQTLDRIQAVGSVAAGSVSLALEFRQGGTALVSAATGPRPSADVLVLGNRGALYHDAGHAASAVELPAGADEAAVDHLTARIQKALNRVP